jgi:hypothetical protein
MKVRGRKTDYEIHKLTNSIWNKEELPEKWEESVNVPIYKKGDKTDNSNYRGITFCQLHIKFYLTSCCQGAEEIIGDHKLMWISLQQVNC